MGKVTLVGAGPGDLGLLSLKGYDAILNADVIVYDRLVGKDILALMPEKAEKINAGKKSANHLIPQEEINKILLEKAQEGKNVVRLKGGDCFLFGRGGEELELLYQNKVDFEVIPGITSALSVPAYAGIPVTHRDFVSSVHIITGHQKKNEPLKIDFESLVKLKGTLVFLMGVSSLEAIIDGLLNAGLDKNMPCGVIENGTRANQRKVIGKAENIVGLCREKNIQSPAIIIVGEVCSLSDKFDWFDNLPLKDKKIVVTRPKERIGKLAKSLKELGADVIEYPCIETKSLLDDNAIKKIIEEAKSYDWLVFTSPAGVKLLFESLREKKKDCRVFGKNKIAVIGSGTARELEGYGVFADLMPKSYNGKCLGEILKENAKGEKILILRAKEGSRELTEELDSGKIEYKDMAIYETVFRSEKSADLAEKINNGEIDFVTFTAASTVKAFCQTVKADFDKIIGLSIGERTSAEANKNNIRVIEAKEASIQSMLDRILEEVERCQ